MSGDAAMQPRSLGLARLGFVARRLCVLAISLWALLSACFLMVRAIPGDPVRASLGLTAPQELVVARRHALGLDLPLGEQYLRYLADAARGDFGVSFSSHIPVAELIAQRLPNTLVLALLAMIVVMAGGVAAGLTAAAAAWNGRRGADLAFSAAAGALTGLPEFILAVLLTAVFAVGLRWLPVAGQTGPASYVLPVLALGLGPAASMARIVRVEALRVLGEDYVRTARAKRLSPAALLVRHVLPNCLAAALTVGGLILASLVAGTVLVENIFAWPGLGSAVVSSITQKDYPLTQGVILVLGAIVLLVSFLVDLAIAVIDPRSAVGEL